MFAFARPRRILIVFELFREFNRVLGTNFQHRGAPSLVRAGGRRLAKAAACGAGEPATF